MMKPSDDVHLGATVFESLAPASENLLVAHRISPLVAQVGPKRAERTPIDADIGRVEVCIDIEIRPIAVFPFANQIGQLANFVERRLGPIENKPVVKRQPLTSFDFVPDRFQ